MIKAISWRVFGTLATMFISYAVTHEISSAIYIGIFEFVSKVAIFYFHERLWGYIPLGIQMAKPVSPSE
jgi:adenylylsulfate kinase